MASLIWCTKTINNSVSITTGVNDNLKVLVDTVPMEITIPQADYYTNYQKHVSVFIDTINDQFLLGSIPVVAKLGVIFGSSDVLRKNVLVLEHISGGEISLNGGNIETVLMS